MTTLLISGSRQATPAMLDYARTCVRRAYAQGWRIYVGDAIGIDAAVAQAAIDYYNEHAEQPEDDLYIYCDIWGLDASPRHGIKIGRGIQYHQLRTIEHRQTSKSGGHVYVHLYHEPCKTYKRRDEVMVNNADKVMCITTNRGTPGTMAVYNYAMSLGKECWLRKDLENR